MLALRNVVAALVLIVCLAPMAAPAASDREEQWLFRQGHGPGGDGPVAIFLSGDYSAVIFRATCDGATHELVLEYFGDRAPPLTTSNPPISIHGSASAVTMSTQLVGTTLIGRVAAGPELSRLLADPGQLEIDAPNEMGEPWYVGYAEPLRRLAWLCQG